MARYKPTSSQAKALLNVTDIEKTGDGKSWAAVVGNAAGPANRIPAIVHLVEGNPMPEVELYDAGQVTIQEATTFKLRREATEALDKLLEAIDHVVATSGQPGPVEDVYRLALAHLATLPQVA